MVGREQTYMRLVGTQSYKGHPKAMELLTVDDIARLMQCSTKHVRHLIWEGKIKAIRPGNLVRVTPAEFERYLTSLEEKDLVPA